MFEMKLRTIHMISRYLLLFGTLSLSAAHDCVQVHECQCVYDSGGGINLIGVNTTSTTNDTKTFLQEGTSVVLNPCINVNVSSSDFTNGNLTVENDCNSDTAVCLVRLKVEMISIARLSELHFETINGKQYLISTNNKWTTKIQLVCKNGTDKAILSGPVDEANHVLNLLLESPRACFTWDVKDTRINWWKVLFMVLFIIAFLYFVGGMLFNKVMFDASGIELIPNHTFWVLLFSRLKESVFYCMNGCKARSAYDQI